MAISTIESVKVIEQQFNTGEEPVLVTCSDMNTYICKYMRSSAAAYKLACELDLFHHLSKEKGQTTIDPITTELKTDYCTCLKRSLLQVDEILTALPKEWNVSIEIVREKLKQLFEEQWISETWNNFMDCINENLSHE